MFQLLSHWTTSYLYDSCLCLRFRVCFYVKFFSLNHPKTGVNRYFGAKLNTLKLAYYRNYCTDSNHVLHSGKDQQMLFVGGPNTRKTNPKWRTAAILKNWKSRKRHEIWHVKAYWPSEHVQELKFSTFKNPRWRTPPPSWKIEKRYVSATGRLMARNLSWWGILPSEPDRQLKVRTF